MFQAKNVTFQFQLKCTTWNMDWKPNYNTSALATSSSFRNIILSERRVYAHTPVPENF